MRISNKPHIPVEILTNILTRLPVKHLVRFKAVCKTWLELITSNDFVKLHLHTSSQSPYPEDRTLVFASKDKGLYSASLDSGHRAVKLDLEGLTIITTFIGSCNGLILCAQCDYPSYKCVALFLVNPLTSQCKRLPIESLSCDTDWNQCFGFGYDHVTDDYKVVCFRYNNNYDVVGDDDGKMVYVYSLKANFWKKISNDITGIPPPNLEFCSSTGVLMNNNLLHWRCMNTSRRFYDDYLQVISFDVTTEKWSKVPLPRDPLFDTRLIEISIDGVGVQGGRLCVMSQAFSPGHGYGVDVWVMKEYGVQESWVKLFKCSERVYPKTFLRFATISFAEEGDDDDDDEIWLTTTDRERSTLKWFGVRGNKSGEARILGVPNFMLYTACTRSLVKLPQTP